MKFPARFPNIIFVLSHGKKRKKKANSITNGLYIFRDELSLLESQSKVDNLDIMQGNKNVNWSINK